jgi:hypothetical protein
MAHNEDVPRPSPAKGRPVVALPALTEAKFEAYRAMRAAAGVFTPVTTRTSSAA